MENVSESGQPYQPPGKNGGGKSPLKIVLIVLGVLALGCLCCTGLMVGMGYFGVSALNDQAYTQLKDSPVIQEEYGTVEEGGFGIDVFKQAEMQEAGEIDPGVLVFSVEGQKGSGHIVVKQQGQNLELVATKKEGEELKEVQEE